MPLPRWEVMMETRWVRKCLFSCFSVHAVLSSRSYLEEELRSLGLHEAHTCHGLDVALQCKGMSGAPVMPVPRDCAIVNSSRDFCRWGESRGH